MVDRWECLRTLVVVSLVSQSNLKACLLIHNSDPRTRLTIWKFRNSSVMLEEEGCGLIRVFIVLQYIILLTLPSASSFKTRIVILHMVKWIPCPLVSIKPSCAILRAVRAYKGVVPWWLWRSVTLSLQSPRLSMMLTKSPSLDLDLPWNLTETEIWSAPAY